MTESDKIYAKINNKYVLDFAPKYMIAEDSQGNKITVEYTEERLLADGYHLVNNETPTPEGEGPWHCCWKLESDNVIHNYWEEYTQEEKVHDEIVQLKNFLSDTDYIYAKCTETGEDVNILYAEVIEQRKTARARIQELEN